MARTNLCRDIYQEWGKERTRKCLTFRIEDALLEQMQTEANRRHITLSRWVMEAAKARLEKDLTP